MPGLWALGRRCGKPTERRVQRRPFQYRRCRRERRTGWRRSKSCGQHGHQRRHHHHCHGRVHLWHHRRRHASWLGFRPSTLGKRICNGTWTVQQVVDATHLKFVVTNAPTGAYNANSGKLTFNRAFTQSGSSGEGGGGGGGGYGGGGGGVVPTTVRQPRGAEAGVAPHFTRSAASP